MFDKGSGFQALVQMADVYSAMNAHEAADMQVFSPTGVEHVVLVPNPTVRVSKEANLQICSSIYSVDPARLRVEVS